MGCDNKGAIDNTDFPYLNLDDMTAAEGDLIKVITETLPDYPNITLKHVRGHQDRGTSYRNLPLEEQLNVDCDREAKREMREQLTLTTRPDPIEGVGATLYIGNNMITTNINEEIAYAAHVDNLREYIKKRHNWTEAEMEKINWKALGEAKQRQNQQQSQRTTKLLHGWLPVGHNQIKMGKEGPCPSCGADDETILHLFQCTDKRMRTTLREEITKAETKLAKANVPVRIYKHFFELYRETCKLDGQHYDIECKEADIARQVQETLGEEAIVRGYLTTEWTRAIEKHWRAPQTHPGEKNPPKQRSPYQMGVLLQETVWSIFEEVWAKRNSILHEPDNHVNRAEMNTITRKLLDYKRNSVDLLTPHDQRCID